MPCTCRDSEKIEIKEDRENERLRCCPTMRRRKARNRYEIKRDDRGSRELSESKLFGARDCIGG